MHIYIYILCVIDENIWNININKTRPEHAYMTYHFVMYHTCCTYYMSKKQLNNYLLEILCSPATSTPWSVRETCLSLPSLRSSTSPALWSWPSAKYITAIFFLMTASAASSPGGAWKACNEILDGWNCMTDDGSDERYRNYRKLSNNFK